MTPEEKNDRISKAYMYCYLSNINVIISASFYLISGAYAVVGGCFLACMFMYIALILDVPYDPS